MRNRVCQRSSQCCDEYAIEWLGLLRSDMGVTQLDPFTSVIPAKAGIHVTEIVNIVPGSFAVKCLDSCASRNDGLVISPA